MAVGRSETGQTHGRPADSPAIPTRCMQTVRRVEALMRPKEPPMRTNFDGPILGRMRRSGMAA